MYTIDLNKVQYPAKRAEELKNRREEQIKKLVTFGHRDPKGELIKAFTQEEAEEFTKDKIWKPLENSKTAILLAIDNYLQLAFLDKETKNVVAPISVRSRAGKVYRKVEDSETNLLELSSDDMEFLMKAFEQDGPANNDFIYVYEVLAEAVEAEKLKKAQEK